jgi:2,4'-dihydroxyacetophenone dioxygenase
VARAITCAWREGKASSPRYRSGVWAILVGFAPGSHIPRHYDAREAEVYTLAGRWNHVEYPDQPQTVGSSLFEPAGSVYALEVPSENTEEALMLVRVRGANVNFNQDGSFHSVLDATALVYLTDLIVSAGLEDVDYIRGGEARHTHSRDEGPTGLPFALATSPES